MQSQSEEDVYTVESIIEKRMRGGKPQYLVKWQGFDSSQNTWEPYNNLRNVKYMVEEFEQSQTNTKETKNKPKQSENTLDKVKKKQKLSSSTSSVYSPEPEEKSKKTNKPSISNGKQSENNSQKRSNSQDEIVLGSYEDNDSANEIMNIRKDNQLKSLDFFIAWKIRQDSRIPQPTWVSDHLLKLHNPEVLCDFLLKKIKWPSPTEQ